MMHYRKGVHDGLSERQKDIIEIVKKKMNPFSEKKLLRY